MLKITVREFARNPNKYKNEPFYLAKFGVPFAKVIPVSTKISSSENVEDKKTNPLNIPGVKLGSQVFNRSDEPVYDNTF